MVNKPKPVDQSNPKAAAARIEAETMDAGKPDTSERARQLQMGLRKA